jgi:hypothetical protein
LSWIPQDDADVVAQTLGFSSESFRKLNSLKPELVHAVLKLGYDVLFSDVDIFFKVNPLPAVRSTMGDADIAIASDAPDDSTSFDAYIDTPYGPSVNGGFYLVRVSPRTVEAFKQIVEHVRSHNDPDSDQDALQAVLCGKQGEYGGTGLTCVVPGLGVKTQVLDRRFVNGGMAGLWPQVTSTSEDDVVMLHHNYLDNYKQKVERFGTTRTWMLDDNLQCVEASTWTKAGTPSSEAAPPGHVSEGPWLPGGDYAWN